MDFPLHVGVQVGAGVAQRWFAPSVTQTWEVEQVPLQGGAGRLAFSTSRGAYQSSRVSGWAFLARTYETAVLRPTSASTGAAR